MSSSTASVGFPSVKNRMTLAGENGRKDIKGRLTVFFDFFEISPVYINAKDSMCVIQCVNVCELMCGLKCYYLHKRRLGNHWHLSVLPSVRLNNNEL